VRQSGQRARRVDIQLHGSDGDELVQHVGEA
jgi:hypothetical protein